MNDQRRAGGLCALVLAGCTGGAGESTGGRGATAVLGQESITCEDLPPVCKGESVGPCQNRAGVCHAKVGDVCPNGSIDVTTCGIRDK